MENSTDLKTAYDKILHIKKLLSELKRDTDDFPAVSKNCKRALASVKMMELNCCDAVEFGLMD